MAAIQRENAVEFVSALVAELDDAELRISMEANAVRHASERLEAAKVRRHKAHEQLITELNRMDVAQSGNYGWEGRVTRFLIDLRRHQHGTR